MNLYLSNFDAIRTAKTDAEAIIAIRDLTESEHTEACCNALLLNTDLLQHDDFIHAEFIITAHEVEARAGYESRVYVHSIVEDTTSTNTAEAFLSGCFKAIANDLNP